MNSTSLLVALTNGIKLLRSPSEPGVRVKKAMYKPGRNWVSTTPTDYYIYCIRPRALLSALRHHLVPFSLYYVTILSWNEANSLHNIVKQRCEGKEFLIPFLISTTQYLYYFQSVSNVKEYSRKINESLQKTLVFVELIVAPLIPNTQIVKVFHISRHSTV